MLAVPPQQMAGAVRYVSHHGWEPKGARDPREGTMLGFFGFGFGRPRRRLQAHPPARAIARRSVVMMALMRAGEALGASKGPRTAALPPGCAPPVDAAGSWCQSYHGFASLPKVLVGFRLG